MIPNIIPYEDDELFYSWIMHIIMHNYADESFMKTFSEWLVPTNYHNRSHEPIKPNYDFKQNLYYWIQNAGWAEQVALDVFMKTSLFPIMSPFMTQYQRELYLVLAFKKLTALQINTLKSVLSTITPNLKLCPECAKLEINNKGTIWYHRAHQIPGVTACHKHGCKLINSPGRKFHELNIREINLSDVSPATETEIKYACFVFEYMNDSECCRYDHMYEFINKKIKSIFCENTGVAFQKYTKEKECDFLFSMKPSYLVNRTGETGTFFDPQNGLAALFTLFGDINTLKTCAKEIETQESYYVDNGKIIKNVDDYADRYIKIHQSEVSAINKRSKELFEIEMKMLTGNEYSLIGSYVDSSEKVKICHKGCNQITEMKPISFLNGKRCKYCKQISLFKDFCEYVEEATNGRYTVTGRASNNLYIIHDRESLLDYNCEKGKAIQELKRKDGSTYFETPRIYDGEIESAFYKIYQDIQKYEHLGIPVFLEDIRKTEAEIPDYTVKRVFSTLEQKKCIVKCYPGVYRFPEDKFTELELLERKYIKRGNDIIGAYYGKSFASMELGLNLVDDSVRYIITNKEAGTHGRSITVYGIKIRVKGPSTKITKDNYFIIQTLDFLLSFWKYTNAGKEETVLSIVNYWIKHEISVDKIKKYLRFFDWKQNNIYKYALEKLEWEYQRKEKDDRKED